MAVSRVSFGVVAVMAIVFAIFLPAAHAQVPAPAPASAPIPTSDGTSIDQTIAYVLMLLALVLTYLIHAADFSFSL